MKEGKPFKIYNVFNNGCVNFSFVYVEETNSRRIAYALTDKNGETHSEIFELGVEDGFFSGNNEPSGGGIYNARTGEYIRGSVHYGQVEEEILNFLNRKIRSLSDC